MWSPGSDTGRRQLRVVQILPDELLDVQREHERSGLGRLRFRRFGRVRQRRRHQVDQDGAQPGRVGGLVGAGIGGQLDQKLRQQHARSSSIRKVPADGPIDGASRQR
jgi:hypothetical protein